MKKLVSYLPTHFLICIIIGICLQHLLNLWLFGLEKLIITVAILSALLTTSYLLKKKITYTILSCILFTVIGISAIYITNNKNYSNYYAKTNSEHSTSILKITNVLKPNNYYYKYIASVIQTDSSKTKGSVLLSIVKDTIASTLKTGQKLIVTPFFKEIPPPLNPNTFNYKSYLANKGIEYQIHLKSKEYILVDDTDFSIQQELADFRIKIQNSLKKLNLSKDELDVMNALLLGQRQDMSKELKTSYIKAGAIHILAISGLHIGIILLILTKLFYPIEKLKYGLIIKTTFIVSLLWLFALFTGMSASVVRATTMFSFITIGNIFQRRRNTAHSLITSMLFLLLIKPMFLFDVGFQLSYLAVFSIIWIQPLLYQTWKPKYKLTHKIWQLITVSIAAQIGILPISLYYFHQFPGLFLLSNIVIIPVLGIILVGGFILIILALTNIAPNFIITTYSYSIQLVNTFIQWISLQETFLFKNIAISFSIMLVLYLLIIASYQLTIKQTYKNVIFLLTAIITMQCVFLYEKQQRTNKEEFIIFHKHKKSIIGIRKGDLFSIYHNLDTMSIKTESILTSYTTENNISNSTRYNSKRIYQYKKKPILCIDSLGIYEINGLQNPIILLQYNPKINLERVIKYLKPQQIIVDGTNYKNNISLWTQTSIKEKTPFWYTGQKGAYIIK